MSAEPAGTRELLEDLAAELTPELTAGALTTDPDVVSAHARDEAPFATVGTALALVRARTVQDVQATLRWASRHRVPVVPQGARSGISGGANAVDGCLLLSVERMDRVLQVNAAEQTVTVEPGIINQVLKDAVAPHGMSYPPDPGSVAISSIGGNLATNAGGLCCVKYGVTRDYVREIAVVLADGTLTRLGTKTAKGVAGLDLCRLFVGSEGTLGVIVEATLRLVPLLPPPLTAVATFPNARAAASTVAEFMGTGARPSLMESMDRISLDLLNRFGDFGLDEQAGALLLMQSDGDGVAAEAAREVAEFAAVAERNHALDVAFSDDPADSDALVAARRMAHPAFERYSHDHGGGQLLDDVCLPRTRIPEFYDRLESVRERTGLTIAVVAHAGDGNMHPAVFFDTADEESVRLAHEAFDEIMAIGLELGGTITGEHGVGSLKSGWLARELDEGGRHLHRVIKDAVDPLGILNPTKQFAAL